MSDAHRDVPSALRTEMPDPEDEQTFEVGFLGRMMSATAFWMALVVIALMAFFSIISPQHAFFQLGNFQDMALDLTETLVLALGMTLILGASELDLSIGANLVLASVLAGKTLVVLAGSPSEVAAGIYPHEGVAIVASIVVGILSGVAFGVVNGLVITRLRINSFIVTLATTGIGTGISYVITGGFNIAYIPRDVETSFGVNTLFGLIPLPTLVVLIIAVILWYVLAFTRFGLHTLAIGSSREASVRSGLKVRRHIFILFVMMGFLAGIDGVLDLFRYGTTNVGGHQTDNLAAIAAVVIGGTSLFGGVASIGGSIIGSMIPIALSTGLIIQGVEAFYQLIVVGVILVIAVFVDQKRRNRLE